MKMQHLILGGWLVSILFGAVHGQNDLRPVHQVAYVAVTNENRIAVYDIAPDDGMLSPRTPIQLPDGSAPGAMAVAPDGDFLYVAMRGTREAATFSIDPLSGDLTLLALTPIDTNAVYITTDGAGQFVLAADYREGKVTVHRLDARGIVAAGPVQTVATDRHAHAVTLDPNNRFVFVPHTGPSAIHQFRFDVVTGRLIPNDPAVVVALNVAGPRHLRFHPDLDRAYSVNELDSTVTVWRFDSESGTLHAMQNLPALPDDYDEANTGAEIQISPDGRFLYASNRGHDSIAIYRIDSDTGRLTFIAHAATEQTPRSFTLDATDRFLYVAGQGSGKLAAYHIDAHTGRLTRTATYDLGENPLWVQIVSLN